MLSSKRMSPKLNFMPYRRMSDRQFQASGRIDPLKKYTFLLFKNVVVSYCKTATFSLWKV
jgi:hypothetical protein